VPQTVIGCPGQLLAAPAAEEWPRAHAPTLCDRRMTTGCVDAAAQDQGLYSSTGPWSQARRRCARKRDRLDPKRPPRLKETASAERDRLDPKRPPRPKETASAQRDRLGRQAPHTRACAAARTREAPSSFPLPLLVTTLYCVSEAQGRDLVYPSPRGG
jgi:hypothetical protein